MIFRGSGPVLLKNPIFFIIFHGGGGGGGGGPDPLSPLLDLCMFLVSLVALIVLIASDVNLIIPIRLKNSQL